MGTTETRENFNRKFAGKGGVSMLLKFYQQGLSPSDIGDYFNLESKQVNYYLKRIVGDDYIRYPWRKLMADLGVGPRLNSS